MNYFGLVRLSEYCEIIDRQGKRVLMKNNIIDLKNNNVRAHIRKDET